MDFKVIAFILNFILTCWPKANLLSAVPWTNFALDFSYFGDTIPRVVTAAVGIVFCYQF